MCFSLCPKKQTVTASLQRYFFFVIASFFRHIIIKKWAQYKCVLQKLHFMCESITLCPCCGIYAGTDMHVNRYNPLHTIREYTIAECTMSMVVHTLCVVFVLGL